jgi:methionyl-tRNA formyltransferase
MGTKKTPLYDWHAGQKANIVEFGDYLMPVWYGSSKDEHMAVVTHADDPKEEIWFASVAKLAFENYLPVYQPADPNAPAFVAAMRALQPDWLFSCYYRHMLKQPVLDLPRLGALNLHGSLLPRYRGRCPVNWVLIHGETETGITLHYMEAKADRGDIAAQKRISITPEDTAVTLFARMTAAAGELFRETYPLLRRGQAFWTVLEERGRELPFPPAYGARSTISANSATF